MIQQVLQHLTSTPEPEPEETDYEVSLPSISKRVMNKRYQEHPSNRSTSTTYTYTTPSRARSHSLQRDVLSGSTSRTVSPMKGLGPYSSSDQERAKIKEFVDVPKMIGALRTLETLVANPDVNYDQFKHGYVSSTQQLVDALQGQDEVDEPVRKKASNKNKTQENKDLVMGIFMVSVQIIRLCVEFGMPFVVQLTAFWKTLMTKPFVKQCAELVGEIVLVSLTLILEMLRSFKEKFGV